MARVLIVAACSKTRDALASTVESAGHQAVIAKDGGPRSHVDIAVVDLPNGESPWRDILDRFGPSASSIPFILTTVEPDLSAARTAVRTGAADYLAIANEVDQLLAAIDRVTGTASGHTPEDAMQSLLRTFDDSQRIGKVGSWDWDLVANRAVWSREMFRIYGRSPEDGVPDISVYLDNIHVDDRAGLEEAIRKSLETGHYEAEYRLVRYSDGQERTIRALGEVEFDAGGQPIRQVGTAIDVTDMRTMERALRARDRQHHMLLEHAGLGIGYWSMDAICLLMNRRACRSLGDGTPSPVGRSADDLFGEEMGRTMRQRIDDAVCHEEPQAYRDQVEMHDGQRVYQSTYALMREDDGRPAGVQIISMDITAQEAAEAARRESEAAHNRSALIIESASDAVVCTDTTGRITFWNSGAERIYGYTRDEAVGSPVAMLYREEDRQVLQSLVDRALAGETLTNAEAVRIGRDGREVDTLLSIATLKNDDGEVVEVVGIARDITDWKQLQRKYREASAVLQAAMDCSPAGIAIADAPEGRLRYVNDAGLGIRGRSREEVVNGVGIAEYVESWQLLDFDGRPLEADEVPLARALMYGETCNRQFIIRRSDQEDRVVWAHAGPILDEQGEVAAAVVVFPDITDLADATAEQERLRSAIEQAFEVVVITDPEGVIEYVNPAFERVSGYSVEETVGQRPSIVKSNVHGPEFYAELWRTISSGGTWKGRIVNRRKDGELFTEEAVISPVRDAGGGISHFVAVKRDITAEIQREEQIRQTQRVEAVGRLAGGVAHDLNNLLFPVLGYAEMLLKTMNADDPHRRPVEEILRASIRARDLVRQLLAFSRRQTLEFKPLDLNSTIERFQTLLRRTIREDIEIDVQLAEDLPGIMADAGQIEQVIMNLAVNAAEAMPAGGRLIIGTGVQNLEDEAAASRIDAEPGRYVVLKVTDTGHGMDDAVRAKIFEPFFTTKGETGTGLGLATVFGIVKQHGGGIWVTSEVGQGTAFDISFPASNVAATKEDAAPVRSLRGGDETILLVEDNDQVRELAKVLLSNLGYRVLVAENGPAALDLLARHDGLVDLLFTDVVMPAMSGKELHQEVQRLRPGLAVLYMSGYPDDIIAQRGILDPGVHCIQKPFGARDLAATVREILDEAIRDGKDHA